MSRDNKLIWEAWQPEFTSKERDRLASVDTYMPVRDVNVDDNQYANMSDLELQDQLEAIQTEIERRQKSRRSSREDF